MSLVADRTNQDDGGVPEDFPPLRDRARFRSIEWRDSLKEWWRTHPDKLFFIGFVATIMFFLLIVMLAIFGVIGHGGSSTDYQVGNGP
jgi:hypothetical protein